MLSFPAILSSLAMVAFFANPAHSQEGCAAIEGCNTQMGKVVASSNGDMAVICRGISELEQCVAGLADCPDSVKNTMIQATRSSYANCGTGGTGPAAGTAEGAGTGAGAGGQGGMGGGSIPMVGGELQKQLMEVMTILKKYGDKCEQAGETCGQGIMIGQGDKACENVEKSGQCFYEKCPQLKKEKEDAEKVANIYVKFANSWSKCDIKVSDVYTANGQASVVKRSLWTTGLFILTTTFVRKVLL